MTGYIEPDIFDRISELNKVKIQRLVAWLNEKELIALMNAADQDLEDSILDNMSRTGRDILLEDLGFTEEEFEERAVVRRKIGDIYDKMIKQSLDSPTKSERKAMIEKAREQLTREEDAIYSSRFKKKIVELGEGLRNRMRNYLDVLERGGSLNVSEPE